MDKTGGFVAEKIKSCFYTGSLKINLTCCLIPISFGFADKKRSEK
jgi:hypothetical protein